MSVDQLAKQAEMTKTSTDKEHRPGYKKTKLGWLPVEWKLKRLKNIIKSLESGVSVNGEEREMSVGEIGVLKVSSVSNGIFLPSEYKVVAYNEKNRVKTTPKKGAILISRANTPDLVAASAFIDQDYPKLFLPDKLWQTVFNEKIETSSLFIFYSLQTNRARKKLSSLATGSSGSMKNISKQAFLTLQIPLPPLPEQQKIAAILSTWDRAIALTRQLLQEKEAQKKGLMQRLLTGKVRVKGFEGGWSTKSIRQVLQIGSGKDYKHLGKGNVPVYGTGGLMTFVDDWLYDGDSVGIGRKGTIDRPIYFQGKFWTVDTLFYTHSFKEALPLFIYYKFLLINWLKYNEASGVPSLSKKTIEKIKLEIPSINEQAAIADILTQADEEIRLLREKEQALQTQKKGLMQRLLTGKVRVNL